MPDAGSPQEAKWLRDLTVKNPAAMAFVSFVREAILFQNKNPEQRCRRFDYVDDTDFPTLVAKMHENADENGVPWGATFLPGVERNPGVYGNAAGSWRVRKEDVWVNGCSEQDVMRHVISQATKHLEATTQPSSSASFFPLGIYELLGKALDKPVPPYLKEYELELTKMVAANHETNSAKRA